MLIPGGLHGACSLREPSARLPRLQVGLSYPHVVPILKQCSVPGTRAGASDTRLLPRALPRELGRWSPQLMTVSLWLVKLHTRTVRLTC
jgi:hypothetical protein